MSYFAPQNKIEELYMGCADYEGRRKSETPTTEARRHGEKARRKIILIAAIFREVCTMSSAGCKRDNDV
jgi:hypothetical protein